MERKFTEELYRAARALLRECDPLYTEATRLDNAVVAFDAERHKELNPLPPTALLEEGNVYTVHYPHLGESKDIRVTRLFVGEDGEDHVEFQPIIMAPWDWTANMINEMRVKAAELDE